VDDAGREITFNPESPSGATPAVIDARHSLVAVACPSSAQCSAVDDRGAEVTFDPVASGAPVAHAIDQFAAVAVACPTTTQCTAVDASGGEVTFNPLAPSQASALVVDQVPLAAVSCRTATDCLAVDQSGRALEGDPHAVAAWSMHQLTSNAMVDVACPSAIRCVGVDQAGDAFVGSSGPLPPAPAAIAPPRIRGKARQGQTLTVDAGSWSNQPTSFRYQWLRCDRTGRRCKAIAGAQAASYKLSTGDIRHRIRVEEWAANITGAGAPQISTPTAPVRPLIYLALWRGSLTGVAKGQPALLLRLALATGEAPLRSVSIGLPRGLAVSPWPLPSGALHISGTQRRLHFRLGRIGHNLEIICRSRTSGLAMTIASGLHASATLSRTVRGGHLHSLRIVLGLAEQGGANARVIVSLRVA
jgi:hypothetical protein